MLYSMNYLSHLHFVGEGWWWGLASSEDYGDEDDNEEKSEDRTHHSSGHRNGVRPLRLRPVCDRENLVYNKHTNIKARRHKNRTVILVILRGEGSDCIQI